MIPRTFLIKVIVLLYVFLLIVRAILCRFIHSITILYNVMKHSAEELLLLLLYVNVLLRVLNITQKSLLLLQQKYKAQKNKSKAEIMMNNFFFRSKLRVVFCVFE